MSILYQSNRPAVERMIEAKRDELLVMLATQCAGYTRVNIEQNGQVDTGFMLNTVQAFGPGELGAAGETEFLDNRLGYLVFRESADVDPVGPREAVTAVAANYAIHQELQIPFLYPAAEQTAEDFDLLVRQL